MEQFIKEQKGMIVVQATILFPIIIMILFALIILSMTLPTRAVLQNIAQETATAMAIQRSDTWVNYGKDTNGNYVYYVETDKSNLTNVYVSVLSSFFTEDSSKITEVVTDKYDDTKIIYKFNGDLEVEVGVINCVIYREIIVSVTKNIDLMINLEFINFPTKIPVSATAMATVQDSDELIRNVDMVVNVVKDIDEEYGISTKFEKVTEIGSKFTNFLGW